MSDVSGMKALPWNESVSGAAEMSDDEEGGVATAARNVTFTPSLLLCQFGSVSSQVLG